MRKTFLQTLNSVDHQIQDAPRQHINDLIEASARTLVKRDGAIPTAVYLQEIADVCAVEQIMPIEHWKTSVSHEANAPIKTKAKGRFERHIWTLKFFVTATYENPYAMFIIGLSVGHWWGARL